MKILSWFILPFFCLSTRGFAVLNNVKKSANLRTFDAYESVALDQRIGYKIKGVSKLMRTNNILPTLLLNFTGGWLSMPSFIGLLKSPQFIVSSIITILVMSYSMVINDLFDLSVDRANKPERPLVTGQVTKPEAILLSAALISMTEFFNSRYMTANIKPLSRLALFIVTIYTPILKRICFVKNLTCAGLISFSIYFSGLATNNMNYNEPLLNIASQFIFWGSFINEVLLDIVDKQGDEKAGIMTVPVIYGNFGAYTIVNFILHFNLLLNLFISMSRTTCYHDGILMMFFCAPVLKGLTQIKKSGFNSLVINRAVKGTVKPMFLTLIYICFLRSIGE